MIEDRRGWRLRHRQTVDGHSVTPRGLAAFVYFSLLYKSLLFNLKVRRDVVSLNHVRNIKLMLSHMDTLVMTI